MTFLPAVLGELAKAGREDALQRRVFATLGGALEERVEIAAFPEFILEGIGLRRGALEREHLEKDLPPRPQRKQQQQQHHGLHHHAGVGNHGNERKIGVQVQLGVSWW
jgi:hypothetical protein